jgi:hypothetical protein
LSRQEYYALEKKENMPDSILRCFPCFWKKEIKWKFPEGRIITGYDVIHIEVPEKEKNIFEEKRPNGKELSLSEYMVLYNYATEDLLPQPLYDCEYECYFFLNGDRFVVIQGWVPKRKYPWLRSPLPWIPKQNISLIGKFQEPKSFGRAKRYEVKEYQDPNWDNFDKRSHTTRRRKSNGFSDVFF